MTDLVTWLRAALNSVESDARSYLELHPEWPDWPQLALAQVTATRRILDAYEDARGVYVALADERARSLAYGPRKPEPSDEERRAMDMADAYSRAIQLLALPHSDWPGYREEWRP